MKTIVVKSARFLRLGAFSRRGAPKTPCVVKGALLVSFRPKKDFPVTFPARLRQTSTVLMLNSILDKFVCGCITGEEEEERKEMIKMKTRKTKC
ncbi:hypothetical protein Hanom_Chr16g01453321 [Helianthus anomalus]